MEDDLELTLCSCGHENECRCGLARPLAGLRPCRRHNRGSSSRPAPRGYFSTGRDTALGGDPRIVVSHRDSGQNRLQMGLPEDELAKLRAYKTAKWGGEGRAAPEIGDVWEVPRELVVYRVEAKDRPHLLAAFLGPAHQPVRAFMIEGTTRRQQEPLRLVVTLEPGAAGVSQTTHFAFVGRRLRAYTPTELLDTCTRWGSLPPERLSELEAAIAACRIPALRRSRALPEEPAQ